MVRGKRQDRRPLQATIVRAKIVDIAKGGEGVARPLAPNGPRAIFVARTAVGDTVDIELVPGSNPARATLRAVVEASPDRVEPPCPYADTCGGCDLMHLSAGAQRRARETIVRNALERAGFVLPDLGRHDAAQREGYRTRVRLAATATRGRVMVGYRAARSHDIVPVDRCLVLEAALEQARASLEPWLGGSEGRGEITLMPGAPGVSVAIRWQGELAARAFGFAEAQVEGGRWSGMWAMQEGASEPAIVGAPNATTAGADGRPLLVPAGGFSQAHATMNADLVNRAVALARCEGRPTLELFSGSGNFTVVLARHTDQLETVEEDDHAVRCARTNLAARGLSARLRTHDANAVGVRPVHRVALLDPPRTGAPGAARALAHSKLRRVVLVSCDPATLARDATTLRDEGGFRLAGLEVFEMFPHTSHVESVAVFERDRGGPR